MCPAKRQKPVSGLPIVALFSLSAALFSQSFAITNLFPYVGAQILYLVPALHGDTNKAGYYAGYLSSAFMVGRFMGGYPLGIVGDRFGRRPVLFLGLTSITIFSMAYGISTTLQQAIMFRVLLGSFNGIVATCKTIVSELCSKEHESRGMGVVIGPWGLGLTFGPALGGILANRRFLQFPFLLPNVACALSALLAMPLVYFSVPETLPKEVTTSASLLISQRQDDSMSSLPSEVEDVHAATSLTASESEDCVQGAIIAESRLPDEAARKSVEADDPCTSLCLTKGGERWKESERGGAVEGVTSMAPSRRCRSGSWCSRRTRWTLGVLRRTYEHGSGGYARVHSSYEAQGLQSRWCTGTTCAALGLYCVFSLLNIMFDEVFPLWAYSTKDHGGLSFSVGAIGEVLCYSGVFLAVFQLFAFPPLARKLGVVWVFRLGCLTAWPFFALTPFVPQLPQSLQLSALIVLVLLPKTIAAACFSALSLLINDAVPTARAQANGIAMALGSFGKAVGPTCASLLYAWSIHNGHTQPPLNHCLTFFSVAALTLLCGFVAFFGTRRDGEIGNVSRHKHPPPGSFQEAVPSC